MPREAGHRGALAARVAGEGTPVVLLHGLAGSGRYWGAAFDDLAAGCRLIVPDLLGFGLSPRPPEPLSAAAHADAVAALLGEVAGGTPAVVAGHSAGCLVALTLARRHPDRVAAVVAFAPPLFPDPATARAAIRRSGLAGRLIARDRRWAWWALAAAHRLRRPAGRLATILAPHLPAALLHGTLTHTWPTYRETLEALVLSADPDQAAWLRLPPLPVHLVAGTADRFLDLTHLRRLAAYRPSAFRMAASDTAAGPLAESAGGSRGVGPFAGSAGGSRGVGPFAESAGESRGGGRTEGRTEGQTEGRPEGRTEGRPSVSLSVWPGAAHDLPLTDPAGCRAELLTVVEQVVKQSGR